MCWLENISLDKRQAVFLKNNYPNPIGPIYSTKAGNDATNGRFNAFAAGGKSDCRKAVSSILTFYSCILINARFSQNKNGNAINVSSYGVEGIEIEPLLPILLFLSNIHAAKLTQINFSRAIY